MSKRCIIVSNSSLIVFSADTIEDRTAAMDYVRKIPKMENLHSDSKKLATRIIEGDLDVLKESTMLFSANGRGIFIFLGTFGESI